MATALQDYVVVAGLLLSSLPQAYSDAMQQAPATQQAVLSVLLDRCLSLLAADCSPETLADATHPHALLAYYLADALAAPCLASQLTWRMQQPGGVGYIEQALRVLTALPTHRGSKGGAFSFGEQHAGAAAVLARLLAPTGRVCLPPGMRTAATWPVMEALPRIAAMLASLAADGSIPEVQLALLCHGLRPAAVLLEPHPAITSTSQLAAWAAAAKAALRLMPNLQQLHERCRSLDIELLQQAPGMLLQELLGLLNGVYAAGEYVQDQRSNQQQPSAANKHMTQQLWALHTSMCRLVAWLAADPWGARAALLPEGTTASVEVLLDCFSTLRFALLEEVHRCVTHGELR